MNIKKYMCLIMAMLMAFSVCFPTAVFAEDWEEMLVEEVFDEYYEQNDDFFVEDEFIAEDEYVAEDEWVEPFIEEQYYEAPVEDEVLVEDEIAVDEPNEESEEAAETPAETTDVSELALSDNDTFDAAYLSIISHPEDATGEVGSDVSFSVTAKNVASYQWKVSVDNGANWIKCSAKQYGGTTTETLSVPVKAARDGYLFKCTLTSATGKTVDTNAAKLTVSTAPSTAPTITDQPKNASGAVGTTVTFTVVAENATGYQWYIAASESGAWNIANAKWYGGTTTDTISVPVNDKRDGYLFKCVVSNDSGSVESNPATLTVGAAPTITDQPKDASGAAGTTVTFSVVAENATGYQWYLLADNDTGWVVAKEKYYAGSTTNTISVPVNDKRIGYMFKCIVSNASGSVESNPATLNAAAGTAPTITEQPKNASGAVGATVTFTVAAENATGYQWYVAAGTDAEWNVAREKYYAGSTTNTISVPVSDKRNGYQFKCVVTNDSGSTESEPATLTVGAAPTITEQPKNASGAAGATVTFTVAAENATGYQWYVAAGTDAEWNVAREKYYAGSTTNTISVPVSDKRNGYQFKCVVTNDIGSAESNPATLTVGAAPTITEQPKDASGAAGETVTFTVAAENATGYQWYVAAGADAEWAVAREKYYAGSTTNTISVPVSDKRNGYQFKCVVTNDVGSAESNPATLTVDTKIEVNGVLYGKLTDTTCAVVGYTSDAASLQVEETVNGMTVTEIGKEAFMDNKNLTSIVLPSTITVIRERAFKNCENLKEMK